MPDPRTTSGLGRYPGARFRCLGCRRFVKATERGVCPRCGIAPPTVVPVGRPDRRIWRRAMRRMRTERHRSTPLAGPLVIGGLIAAGLWAGIWLW